MRSGTLQLADGTHVVLDESALEAGRLNQNGLRNLDALNDLAGRQLVNYDFGYHPIQFNVNAPVCILSNAKSMLKVHSVPTVKQHFSQRFDHEQADCHIPLVMTAEPVNRPIELSQLCMASPTEILVSNADSALGDLRCFLSMALQQPLAEMDDCTGKIIEGDYMKARQMNSSVVPETLYSWLAVSK